MSFSSMAAPAFNGARSIFRFRTLGDAARFAGASAMGGIMAASYQIAYEEGRNVVQGMRVKSLARRERNDIIMCALLQTNLPLPALTELRKSRDLMREVIDRSVDPMVPPEIRETLRQVLQGLMIRTQQTAV